MPAISVRPTEIQTLAASSEEEPAALHPTFTDLCVWVKGALGNARHFHTRVVGPHSVGTACFIDKVTKAVQACRWPTSNAVLAVACDGGVRCEASRHPSVMEARLRPICHLGWTRKSGCARVRHTHGQQLHTELRCCLLPPQKNAIAVAQCSMQGRRRLERRALQSFCVCRKRDWERITQRLNRLLFRTRTRQAPQPAGPEDERKVLIETPQTLTYLGVHPLPLPPLHLIIIGRRSDACQQAPSPVAPLAPTDRIWLWSSPSATRSISARTRWTGWMLWASSLGKHVGKDGHNRAPPAGTKQRRRRQQKVSSGRASVR